MKRMITVVFIGLLTTASWSYLSIKAQPVRVPNPVASLSVIPDYMIISGSDLKVWPKETLLEHGNAAYFYAAKPTVTMTTVIKVSGMQQGLINGSVKSEVIIQSIDDSSQIYWSYRVKEQSLVDFTLTQGNSGQKDQSTFRCPDITLDIPAAYQTAIEIGDELFFQNGLLQMLVISELRIHGTVNDNPIDKSIVHTLPIDLLQTSFTLPKSEEAVTQVSISEQEDSPTLSEAVLEIILKNQTPFILSFILLLLLLVLIMINERNKPKAAKEHLRFKEWITEGSVEVKDRLAIHILSLEGLVDLAIDLDKRVIHDPKVNRYYVLTEDIVYTYDLERTKAILENKQQLGKLLLNQGLINPEQLEIGLYHQNKFGCRLGESLIALGFIDETTLYSTLASQKGIDYYELNPQNTIIDPTWMKQLNVHQAKAMMVVPLGISSDQRIVIASSEASREGIKNTLQEIFGRKVHLVSSKPSAIYEVLDSMEKKERLQHRSSDTTVNESYERLSIEERKQFLEAYHRGSLRMDLLLKALDLITPGIINQVAETDNLLNWLSGKNLIQGDMANLIRGLTRYVQALEYKDRQTHLLPNITDILYSSNYITRETKAWLDKEAELTPGALTELLRSNFISSDDTIRNIETLLRVFRTLILGKTNEQL
jgi:hypothetical protein